MQNTKFETRKLSQHLKYICSTKKILGSRPSTNMKNHITKMKNKNLKTSHGTKQNEQMSVLQNTKNLSSKETTQETLCEVISSDININSSSFSKTRNINSMKTRNITPTALKEIGDRCNSTKDIDNENKFTVVYYTPKEANEMIQCLLRSINEIRKNMKFSDAKYKHQIESLVTRIRVQDDKINNLETLIQKLTKGSKSYRKNFIEISYNSEEKKHNPVISPGDLFLKSRNEEKEDNKIITSTFDSRRTSNRKSMSCKNILERSNCSHNITHEIENEIKEMNIINSYERTGCSLEPNRSYIPIIPQICKKDKNRLSQKIKSMKSARSQNDRNKITNKTMLKFPTLFNKKFKKQTKLFHTKKVKELKVDMYDDYLRDHVIEQILSSSIKSSGRKDPRQQSALIKHRSEADIFASLKESKSLQQNNFISEIQNYRSCCNGKDCTDEYRSCNSKYKKGPISKTIDLKAYLK